MTFHDAMDHALARAREVQKQIGEAAEKTAEQMKPHVVQSLASARELQAALSKHVEESGASASEQAQVTLDHLNDFVKMGTDALRESAEKTRETTIKMVEKSKKVVAAARAAAAEPTPKGPPRA